MDNETELHALHVQLAAVAREIARELIREQPDADRVAELDADREVLLARIRRATPPRDQEYDLIR